MLDPVIWYRLARWLFVHRIPLLPRVIDRVVEFVFHCRLPHTVEIGEGFEVNHYGLGVFLHHRVQVGRNVFISHLVTVGGRSQARGVPRIQDNVYVGPGAKILGDIVVGEGAVIGANAVVIHSVPPHSIAAGVPARIVRENIDVYEYTGWPKALAPSSTTLPTAERPEEGATRVFYMMGSARLGGSESQVVEIARRLNSGRHRVTMGCLTADGPFIEVLRQAGIPVVEFPVSGGLLRPRGIYQLLRLAWFLRQGRFDVVHTHDLWSNLLGVPAAWLARVPMIISSRRDLAHFWWYTPRNRKILRHVQNLSTFVLTNSEAVRDFLVREDGFAPTKLRVIRNGVDFVRFASARGKRDHLLPRVNHNHKLVAVVANMNLPVKGHTYLIEAARTICRALPQTTFLLIGDGRQRPKLEQQVRGLGLEENFLFLGYRKDVPELLSCCDLSVLASTAEGLPNAALESMAAGLPVVATSVGGTVEVIEDGVSGLLAPPRNPEILAQAILRVLQDQELARRLAEAGQERARTHFSFTRVLLELKELYEESQHRETARQEKAREKEQAKWHSVSDPAAIGLEVELGSDDSAQLVNKNSQAQ